MPVTLATSEHDPTILIIHFGTQWSWQETIDLRHHPLIEAARTSPHRIDFIVNLLDSPSLPFGALIDGPSILSDPLPNWGITVAVTTNRFILTMIEMYKRIFAQTAPRIFVAATLEEAQAIIQEQRRSAPAS